MSKQALEYPNLLLWERWDLTGVKVEDPGLQTVINVRPILIPHSGGRHEHKKFGKTRVNIVERLVNEMMHFGKKYAKNTGRMGGKKQKAMNVVKTSFAIIELRTGQNPVQQLVKAIENSSPNEDTTRLSYGGVVYHQSVDIAPVRRVDLALRFISEGVRESAFNSVKSVEEVLADEIIQAASGDSNSYAVKKKNEQERVAMASR
ncbi:MAG: 30S ribosomal protein S7 [Nitrososphaerota archaeon]|jgi:small subunit ribosomal protein S7|nr:30S ribosomal protein S7 [Nitrososphaerota archaeon]MDG6912663.1 30S ribosomal protein S7 [Nitrososphaerota archaeon]MDG6937311.1 30S ribosomal protein S7 [Nitrososphaerota archaeon]MDG6961329.1 30S ribosomal protein S7 [Nitrososphaerota archaeon]MDG6962853.1 30S ribosomal protein S7 [Nitrososphaerota archaeon]